MRDTAFATWVVIGGTAILAIFLAILAGWHRRREENLCLIVLINTTKEMGMITTEGFARRSGMTVAKARKRLDRLFVEGLAYGCTDEELWWYWKITEKGRERLIELNPELDIWRAP